MLFGKPSANEPEVDLKVLHVRIDQLTLENDSFRKRTQQGGIAECKAMVDHGHKTSITRQAGLVGVSRVGQFTLPKIGKGGSHFEFR